MLIMVEVDVFLKCLMVGLAQLEFVSFYFSSLRFLYAYINTFTMDVILKH